MNFDFNQSKQYQEFFYLGPLFDELLCKFIDENLKFFEYAQLH